MTDPAPALLPGLPGPAEGWARSYLAQAGAGDVMRFDMGRGAEWWRTLLEGASGLTDGRLARLQERVTRQVAEIGTTFRLPGDDNERAWPLSGLPLLIGEDEWRGLADGVAQRAELMERVLGDLYGAQTLVSGGRLPAAVVTGSRHFWRGMVGLQPAGRHRLHIYAADLGRGPDGEWRVLADHVRSPTGAGYALENRLAASRVMGSLQARLNVQRFAGFFSAFRDGLAAVCRRADPRIGLLTPGRYTQSYAEQAHLARYLGLLLVEGDDLAVRDGQLFVRTIEGLKRVDALWRRMDSRYLDPLAFDSDSAIGVPGLIDAMAAGSAVIANAPGAGVVESAAFAAFLPALARHMLGRELMIPNIATWWCGQPGERARVEAELDELLIAPAFGGRAAGLDGDRPVLGAGLAGLARARLLDDLKRRPMDYVGQEVVRLSTMPAIAGATLRPRPFTLRVFAARDAAGRWTVMPGGFARLGEEPDPRAAVMGEGAFSADVCVVAARPVEAVSLLPSAIPIRRNPGTLPSRAADNLFWLGRYLERAEGNLRLARAVLGSTIEADGGAGLAASTAERLRQLLEAAAPPAEDEPRRSLHTVAATVVTGEGGSSVRALMACVRTIAEGTRDRLSADVWRLIEDPPAFPDSAAELPQAVAALGERFAALAGSAAENMGRTAGWRFHDLGRRIERGVFVCRLLRGFAGESAQGDDLTLLLDLVDSQISYRARYFTGLALVPVRDLVALDPFNPRSLAFQTARIAEHLAALPTLHDDGMAEEQQRQATELQAQIATVRAEALHPRAVRGVEARLTALSDAIGARFFLQGVETLRASGMTLA